MRAWLRQVDDAGGAEGRGAPEDGGTRGGYVEARTATSGVIPYLTIEGAAEASLFYQRALGAQELERMAAEHSARLLHCHLVVNGGSLMLCDNFPEYGAGTVQRTDADVMQLIVGDGDAWWSRALEAGCTVRLPFKRAPWGDRYGQFVDPFGVVWALLEPANDA